MASSIQLLRSTNAQERPFPSNLLEGQPAVNINSSEPGLFLKATDGSLIKFGPAAVTSDGLPPNSSAQGFTGNTVGELWLDKAPNPPILKVFDGTDWIDAGSGNGGGGGNASLLRWVYTAAGGETSLSGTSNGVFLDYTPGLEEVYINGVLTTRGADYNAINGTSITNLAALTAGDVVTVLSLNPLNTVQLPGQVTLLRWAALATSGQTSLSGADSSGQQLTYTAGFEEVYVNGAFLRRGVDYTANDGSTITGLGPLVAGDEITVLAWSPFAVGSLDSDLVLYTYPSSTINRSVEAKLSESLSVKDFGAAGDGLTDDAPAFQAAIDAANSQGVSAVQVPSGKYRFAQTVTLKHGVSLIGEAAPAVKFLTSTDVYFTQIRSEVDGPAISIQGGGSRSVSGYSASEVRGISLRYIGGNVGASSGIKIGNSSVQAIQASIDGCLIQGFGKGIENIGTWNVFVSDTYIYSVLTASPSDPAVTYGVYMDAVARPATSNYFKNVAVQACDVGFCFLGLSAYSGGESLYTDNCGIGFLVDGSSVSPGRGFTFTNVGVEGPRVMALSLEDTTCQINGFHFVKGTASGYTHVAKLGPNVNLAIYGGDDIPTGSYGSTAAFECDASSTLTIYDLVISQRANKALVGAGKVRISRTNEDQLYYGGKLQNEINVKEFGAVGDGVTDDAAAINSAINYAESLKFIGSGFPQKIPKIRIPEGIYLINSSIIVKPGISICGDGPNATVIKSPNGTAFDATSPGLTAYNSFFHEISGMSIYGGNTAASPVAGSWGSGIHAIGWIRGCVVKDVYINGFEYGIQMFQCWTVELTNIYVNTSSVDSIFLTNCGQATVDESRLDNCSEVGLRLIDCESFRLLSTSIQKSRLHGLLTNSGSGAETLLINGCFFERNGENGTGLGTDIYSEYGDTTVISCFFTQPLSGLAGPATAIYASNNMTLIGALTRGGTGKTGCRCDGKLTAINNRFGSTNSIEGGDSDGSLWVNNTGQFNTLDPKIYVHGPLVFKNNSPSLENKFTKRVFTSLYDYNPGSTATIRITLGERGGLAGEMMVSFRLSVVATHPTYQSDRRIFDYQCTYQYAVPTVHFDQLSGNYTPTFDQSSVTGTGGSFDVILPLPTVSIGTAVKSQIFVTLEGAGWADLEFV